MTRLGNATGLRARLKRAGLTDALLDAAWPTWWSDEAEESLSARAELRLSLARRLGLDPASLLEDDTPQFVWHDAGRFKHLSAGDEAERDLLTAFGHSLAAIAVAGAPTSMQIVGQTAEHLRAASTGAGNRFVRLVDLLALCWSAGIPVLHLRVFPLRQKRMAAMAARVGERWAVLLGKDSSYPAHIAFYLAHELGHIVLGHLADTTLIADFEPETAETDVEESAADAFALELLTGNPSPTVLPHSGRGSARELARTSLDAGPQLGIEPGTLALCFGHATGDWATANAAMPFIYEAAKPVWQEVNRVAVAQLSKDLISADAWEYMSSVIGLSGDERSG